MNLRKLIAGADRPAWVHFFVGLAGLGAAFVSALFSTVFRENGNEWGTAISASAALLIAGFVAIYTVPYLAKRAAMEGFREVIDYDVTREGLVYLVVALIVSLAALNTGNNLLFIVVAAMLTAIIVSGIASAGILRGLRLDTILPSHVFARQSVMARINLKNSYRIASFSVSVVPPQPKNARRFVWERGVFGFPPKRPQERQWFRVADLKLRYIESPIAPDSIFHGSVYFPYISAKSTAHADVELHFQKRGLYSQDEFGIATRFPFSFLRKTRRIPMQREVIVYPSVAETDEFFQVLPMITGEFEAYVAGRGHDLYRIREHQPGDSARLVDWKASAKSGTLKVREFTREDERKLRIIFDNPTPEVLSEAEYESAVTLTASLAWHFAGTNTQLTFVAPGYNGSSDVLEFLKYLALVKPAAGVSSVHGLQATPDYNIIITAQQRGSLPTNLWTSSYIVFLGQK